MTLGQRDFLGWRNIYWRDDYMYMKAFRSHSCILHLMFFLIITLLSKPSSNLYFPLRLFTHSSPYLPRLLSTTARDSQKDGWLNKLLVRKIEPTKESHSRMLSDKEVIYELQTHNLKPGTAEAYLKN